MYTVVMFKDIHTEPNSNLEGKEKPQCYSFPGESLVIENKDKK